MAAVIVPYPYQTGFQVVGGEKLNNKFAQPQYSTQQSVTAAGTARASATAILAAVTNITTAAASTGVALPAGVPGLKYTIFNGGANTIKVYGNGSDTIDGIAGSTGVSLSNAARCNYYCVAANTWISALLGAVSA